MLKSNKLRGHSVSREQRGICHVWEEKRGPTDFSPAHLHCNPDFPMFDPSFLLVLKSVAKLFTNTSLIQLCTALLSYSITVTQVQHETEKSKQRMTISILSCFSIWKHRMQLNLLDLILTWSSLLWQMTFLSFHPNELFKFSPKPLCFSYGYRRRPKSLKFYGSVELLTAKLHPIQTESLVPQNVGG